MGEKMCCIAVSERMGEGSEYNLVGGPGMVPCLTCAACRERYSLVVEGLYGSLEISGILKVFEARL